MKKRKLEWKDLSPEQLERALLEMKVSSSQIANLSALADYTFLKQQLRLERKGLTRRERFECINYIE